MMKCTYCGDLIGAQEAPAPVSVDVRYVTNASPQGEFPFCGISCVGFWAEAAMFT